MKFICTQGNLLRGLVMVGPLSGRNPQLPVLQHVLLEVKGGLLHLTCTDLEVGAHVTVAGKAEKEGNCTVPARQLMEYIQQLPESNPIEISLSGQRLGVSTKGFSAKLPLSAGDDFPLLPIPDDKDPLELDSRLFCQALAGTIFAAAKDETRPELHGIYIGSDNKELRVAATDSFRLAERVIELEAKKDFEMLLPIGAAQEVVRLFGSMETVKLLRHKNYVSWQGGGAELSSRLIDGSYPDYRRVLPQVFVTEGAVDKSEFHRALKVLGVFLPRDSRRITLKVKPKKDVLELKVEGGETGQGQVEVLFNGAGEEIETLFNISYLLDGVSHLNGDLQLRFGGTSEPLLLEPKESKGRHLYVVMPIQT